LFVADRRLLEVVVAADTITVNVRRGAMNSFARLVIVIPFCVMLVACDNEREEKEHAAQAHVWQGQVHVLNKAKEVEGTLMSSAEQQRQTLDQRMGATQ
jgi:hypothetical protein